MITRSIPESLCGNIGIHLNLQQDACLSVYYIAAYHRSAGDDNERDHWPALSTVRKSRRGRPKACHRLWVAAGIRDKLYVWSTAK